MRPETKETKARKKSTKGQRAPVITFQEVRVTDAKIADRTEVPKTTGFDIVKRDQESRKVGELTTYTASAPHSGHPEEWTC